MWEGVEHARGKVLGWGGSEGSKPAYRGREIRNSPELSLAHRKTLSSGSHAKPSPQSGNTHENICQSASDPPLQNSSISGASFLLVNQACHQPSQSSPPTPPQPVRRSAPHFFEDHESQPPHDVLHRHVAHEHPALGLRVPAESGRLGATVGEGRLAWGEDD